MDKILLSSEDLPYKFRDNFIERPDCSNIDHLKIGESLTVSGVHPIILDPDRRWWQFWKPELILDNTRLVKFKIIHIARGDK